MPYQFRFFVHNALVFQGQLQCNRCIADNVDNTKCKRIVCLGLPYCFQHLKSFKHLQIRDSEIPNSGKGLFAVNPDARRANAVVFNTDGDICDYHGELIDHAELVRRYGTHTAPYGMTIKQHERYEDGALVRGVGTLVNHMTGRNANAAFKIVMINKKAHHVKLQALKPIRNGDEIYVDYGNEYLFDEPTSYSTRPR
jgi:hypothetical protein